MKIGDKVICPSKPKFLYNNEPNWALDMDKRAGTIGTIVDIDTDGKCEVVFDDGEHWWYAARWLEQKYTIGDKVQVVTVDKDSELYALVLDEYVGDIGVIRDYSSVDNSYQILFSNTAIYWFKEDWLRPIYQETENLNKLNNKLILLL